MDGLYDNQMFNYKIYLNLVFGYDLSSEQKAHIKAIGCLSPVRNRNWLLGISN